MTTRGRPRKNNNIIEVNNIKLEFIITKADNYQNEISYFKIIDKQFKSKLQPITSQMCDECNVPIWKTDDGFYMLKVKLKWMPERDFEQNEILNADLNFKYYCMTKEDGDLIQGYWVKLLTNNVISESV